MIILVLLFYVLSAVFYLLLIKLRKNWVYKVSYFSAITGFIFNIILVIYKFIYPLMNRPVFFLERDLQFSMVHIMLYLITIFIILIFISMQLKHKYYVSGIAIMPLVSLIILISIFIPEKIKQIEPVLASFWFPVHVILTLLSYSAFTVAFCSSLGFLIHEKNIKQHHLTKFYFDLPSLESLDELNYSLITTGIIYLTCGIITGAIWSKIAWGDYWIWETKQVFSLLTWLIYIGALHLRLFLGWRNKRTAYIAIIGFVLVIITFFGTNFLVKGFHSFL